MTQSHERYQHTAQTTPCNSNSDAMDGIRCRKQYVGVRDVPPGPFLMLRCKNTVKHRHSRNSHPQAFTQQPPRHSRNSHPQHTTDTGIHATAPRYSGGFWPQAFTQQPPTAHNRHNCHPQHTTAHPQHTQPNTHTIPQRALPCGPPSGGIWPQAFTQGHTQNAHNSQHATGTHTRAHTQWS